MILPVSRARGPRLAPEILETIQRFPGMSPGAGTWASRLVVNRGETQTQVRILPGPPKVMKRQAKGEGDATAGERPARATWAAVAALGR